MAYDIGHSVKARWNGRLTSFIQKPSHCLLAVDYIGQIIMALSLYASKDTSGALVHAVQRKVTVIYSVTN